jgi:hypothetical protein
MFLRNLSAKCRLTFTKDGENMPKETLKTFYRCLTWTAVVVSTLSSAEVIKKKPVVHKVQAAKEKKPAVLNKTEAPSTNSVPNSIAKAPLHVFTDEKHILFWPIDLPFWVRLATAPEDGGQSFLLKKFMSTPNTEAPSDNSKDAIKLEISGSQFIRWMNYVSKGEVKYRFVADSGAPLVSYKFANAPLYSTGGKSFYGRGLTATVVAKDEHAGVQSRHLSVNELPFVTAADNSPLAEERLYKLRSYAVDRVGYTSDFVQAELQVDLSPPKSTTQALGVYKNDMLSPQAKIAIASTDSLSGVKQIRYKMDADADFKVYDSKEPIKVEALADGQHVLSYYSVDQVDNREDPKKYEFTLNATPPSMAHTFIGPHFSKQDRHFIASTTQLKIDANSQVAVKDLKYRIGKSPEMKYSGPFLPDIKNGEETISYESQDELGNTSPSRTVKIVMDVAPPASKYAVEGPNFSRDKGGVVYVAEKSKVTLKSDDELSGVKKISYQINDQPIDTYKGAFSVGKEGRFMLRYWGTDMVDNNETIATILIIADSSPPEIVTVFSQDSIKGANKNIHVFKPGLALTVDAIDSAAGVANIFVNVQGKGEAEYRSPIVFSKPGTYRVDIKVADHVGNVSRKLVAVEVVGEGWNPVAH